METEILEMVLSAMVMLLALGASYAIKKLKKTVYDKVVSEEQADMILDELEAMLPEEHKPRLRTLRQSWDDETVTTEQLEALINRLK